MSQIKPAQSVAPINWQPTAELAVLKLRAQILQRIRGFFSARDILEVETPILSAAATTDPQLHSFNTCYSGPGAAYGRTLFLHTSPEFAMKRLLAAGVGSIYQICKVFRDTESGRFHNPEFTLLEWYRVGFDHHQLMDEVTELVTHILEGKVVLDPVERLTYRQAFLDYAGIDPYTAGKECMIACAQKQGIHTAGSFPDQLETWRDLLLTHVIEPQLGKNRLTFLYDYPASQASLACIRPGTPPLAERFELYLHGIELANGFHELDDPREQRRRFETDLSQRRARGLPAKPHDERLLAALAHGLPACAGVALGIDRLVMPAAGVSSIADVIAFNIENA
jgi:lysyl-tRNA synthetase class 2